MRLSSWRCASVLRVLDLYYKVAIFELEMRKCTSRTIDLYYKVAISELEMRKCTSRTRIVLQSWDFRTGSAKVRKHCKTIRSPPKTITFKKVLGPSKVFRPLLIYIYIYHIHIIYTYTVTGANLHTFMRQYLPSRVVQTGNLSFMIGHVSLGLLSGCYAHPAQFDFLPTSPCGKFRPSVL